MKEEEKVFDKKKFWQEINVIENKFKKNFIKNKKKILMMEFND